MVSHRRVSQSGLVGGATRATVLSAAAVTAAAALSAGAVQAAPRPAPADVSSRIDALYEQAEKATEEYNGATERTRKLRTEVSALQDRVARGQEHVNRLRARLGAVASAQYRSGGLDPALKLMLSENPADYLDKAAALDRVQGSQAGQLRELQGSQRGLEQERKEAAGKLAALEASRRDVAHHKKDVEHKLAAAQRLLNSLPGQDRAAYDRANRGTGRSLPDPAGTAPVSGRAGAAVQAVRAAIGSPYSWGQSGPSSFDCSGLMQWAYARAGVAIPRTSQAQRGAGQHVQVSQAKPGDLVIYRDDASHVGMYVGNGQVVHAPYPGARVRSDPVGMMPISTVTRP
ncbi:NlpC/P60 family protein [Streptomyces sp. NPDC017529]|uniref:C40 family peptidase n=1 Tax=Streptomyces sp. NPDC017529 TaxID=3365000 RepID=UPI0037B33082